MLGSGELGLNWQRCSPKFLGFVVLEKFPLFVVLGLVVMGASPRLRLREREVDGRAASDCIHSPHLPKWGERESSFHM